ncbi:MAG: ABC transporter permease [Terracidiphilus sp.]|nr:ABC transporter permease [Terracidiphilus sp.]
MRSILQDLRYALRQLRHSPAFAVTAVAVLALGLGANIAVFTVLNGILLRPLPYAQPDRVVTIQGDGPQSYYPMRYANMLQLRDAVGERMQVGGVLCCGHTASIVGPGGRVQVEQQEVTANLPSMLGVHLLMGRTFRDEENEPGRNRVALIGEDVWRKLYNSDAHIVGQTLTIKSQPYTILGVIPSGLSIPYDGQMQIWSPAALSATDLSSVSRGSVLYGMYARLPDGMTEAQLADQLSRTQAVIAKEAPDGDLATRVVVTGYQKSLNKDVRKPLLLLYAVVFGIWLLACLNVTSLMLARAVSRSREQAVRAALGASRLRLLQQAIVESLLLSSIGAAFALLLGQTAIKLLWRQIHRQLPLSNAIHLDWRVVACMAALTLLTAVVVGVFPVLLATRRDVQSGLHGVTTTASASQNRTREALVVAQLALTLIFLVGAGLFLRTIHALRSVPLGFTQQNVLTGGIILNGSSGSNGDEAKNEANIVTTSYLPLLARLRAMPGVKAAALSSVLPLRAEFAVTIGGTLDHKEDPKGKEPMIDGRLASSGLVEALGIPMVRGRFFTENDTSSAPVVVVVNQAFVNKYLPGKDPIGHTFGMGKGRFAEMRIVGVIGDVKQSKVTDPTKPEMYFCLAQMEPGMPLYGIAIAFIQVAIRGAVPADTLRVQFDKALHEVAPDATTTDVKTIHEAVEDSFGSQTLIAHLLESFGFLALLIASVGLYGLLSFAVAQRTREIGLRIALGAPQGNILSLILRRALLLVGVGLTLGGALAWFAVKFASSYIFGVRAHDGLTFAAVLLVLAAASLLAAWLPAHRAASVDPILALRSE